MSEGKLEFIAGGLGAAKTSMACELGFEHLLKGGTVVSNIEWYPDVVARVMADDFGLVFEPERLVMMEDGAEFWKHAQKGDPEGLHTMFIIDEAHVEHNARAWEKTSSQETIFNTMARKLCVHLIYVTQDINNVDKQFRRMAQKIWYCRSMKQFLDGWVDWLPFNIFFRVPYACGPGTAPKRGNPVITFRPTSWGMFNSHALVGRAATQFSILKSAQQSPLKRTAKRRTGWQTYKWAVFAGGLSAWFL